MVGNFPFLIFLSLVSFARGTDCPRQWFDCGNGKCVSNIWVCDGDNDCGNFEDERNCEERMQTEQQTCLSSQFKCESDNRCIPKKWRCDGGNDCSDGSDEMHCAGVTTCTGFKCRNGFCLPKKWHCDEVKDCPDGSDEEFCGGVDPCENNTCSQHCKNSPFGPQCYCENGFALDEKDNETCIDIDECLLDGICSYTCINTPGSYKCICNSGYELVNKTCRAEGPDSLLIYSILKEIRGMRLRSKENFTLIKAESRATVMDVDPNTEQLYWIEISEENSTIFAANLDGSGSKTIISLGLLILEGIAVDYVAHNIYLTDSKLKQVLACKMDGKMCHVLHNTNVEKPRSIVLDPNEGFMYWSDWGNRTAGIYRSGMDGSHRMSLVTNRIGWPNGIALDHSTNRLYWTDGQLGSIEYITLDLRTRKVIGYFISAQPYSLTVFEDTIYWSDWRTRSLVFCNKFTGQRVFIAHEKSKPIMGIHVYHPILAAKEASNPCSSHDCSHMCLISPGHNYSCACPEGYDLLTDLKTCKLASVNCPDHQVTCASGKCISMQSRCNGEPDCSDGSDELNCSATHCSDDQMRCDSGQCVAISRMCDGAKDCFDESDEKNCRTNVNSCSNLEFQCETDGSCIDGILRCVGIAECNDESDEKNCTLASVDCSDHQVTCASGKCISVQLRCNGEPDCSDGSDELNCNATPCSDDQMQCDNGQCVSMSRMCDGAKDCFDESDEKNCSTNDNSCSNLEFQCETDGSCIDGILRCNGIAECNDESDEKNCTLTTVNCAKDQILCPNGECIAALWRCDGEPDCSDGSDELNCNTTRCNYDQIRCDHGQCIPLSWMCDKMKDCLDGSDEKNCSTNVNSCSIPEFKCETDGSCIDGILRCNGKADCNDESDEKNCPQYKGECKEGMFMCKNGLCLYDYEVCDGHNDCSQNEDEMNCTHTVCQQEEHMCPGSRRCISKKWICDGDTDCPDGSDEERCWVATTSLPTLITASGDCDDFYCHVSGQCLPWSKVCDGHPDCAYLSDEGGLCSSSCEKDNGGCSHICMKTPRGSKCACYEGYRLLHNNKTCEDIDECYNPGTCSHFCVNTKGSYQCSCTDGYSLQNDRRSCKAKGGQAMLMYLLIDQLCSVDLYLNSTKCYPFGIDIRSMDYDAADGTFYLADSYDGSINKVSTKNLTKEIIFQSSTRPIDIKYDWIAKNLYLLYEDSSIGVCTKDGNFCKIIVKPKVRILESLAIAPISGLMFWTSWQKSYQRTGIIERAEMDGSHRVIISDNSKWPSSITVDNAIGRIYWTDGILNTVECADFHGFQRRIIVHSDAYVPFALAVFEDDVYWSDMVSKTIMKCNKFADGHCERISNGNIQPHSLLVAHYIMQPKVPNPCQYTTCEHMCVLTRFGYVCMSADDRSGSKTTPLQTVHSVSKGKQCSQNEFQCSDEQCVPAGQKCDGNLDCNDGSDEQDCEQYTF